METKHLSALLVIITIILFDGCSKKSGTVTIGKQVWMVENLNVDHYRNGDLIPQVSDPEEWRNLKTAAWCYYNNDPENGKKYGRLYNWYAVNDSRGLAPIGWHIPTFTEFKVLAEAVHNDGNALKAEGQKYDAGTNTSGFSALFAGQQSGSSFSLGSGDLGHRACFWTISEDSLNLVIMFLSNFNNLIDFGGSIYNFPPSSSGYSVRCIKD